MAISLMIMVILNHSLLLWSHYFGKAFLHRSPYVSFLMSMYLIVCLSDLISATTGENWNGLMRDCMVQEPFCSAADGDCGSVGQVCSSYPC
jgi:hypothetical protein